MRKVLIWDYLARMKRIMDLMRSRQKMGEEPMLDASYDPLFMGTLAYDSERNCLTLDSHTLQRDERMEIRIFDAWISGAIAVDAGGWYLITEQVEIRLHSGLSARMYEASLGNAPAPSVIQQESSHILIVDDDPALLDALSRTVALRLPGVHINTSTSAQQALEQLQARHHDAVVSDIKMPGMDGLELLARIRELQPETPTLLITGHGEHELAIRALRGGAYDYIQKPIERDSFIAALRRAIQTCQLRRQVAEQQRSLELHARSLEHRVQQRTHELVEAHEAKDKVIGLVSHELNGPIARLKEITLLLHQKIGSSVDIVNQSFSEIEQSLARTEELMHALEDTAHIETRLFILHRRRCDLVALCYKVLSEIAVQASALFSWQCPGGPIEVEADGDLICQVLHTLLTDVQKLAQKNEPVEVMLQQTWSDAIISVRNLDSHASMGVDFYIARKILEQHHGHLEIQSFPHDRRTLFITLPLPLHDQSESMKNAARPALHAVGEMLYPGQVDHALSGEQ